MLTEITNQTKITWASISNGKIVIRSNSDDPKAVKRINKKGNEVYERFYASISGRIQNISLEENIYNEKEIKVSLINGDNVGVLSIKVDSSYGRSFMAQIFNVDLKEEVSFNPWSKKTEETTKSALYLNYSNKRKVEYKFPDGTPQVIFHDLKGKKVVDNISVIKHQDFLEEKLNQFIKDNKLEFKRQNAAPDNFTTEEWEKLSAPLSASEKRELNKMKKAKNEDIEHDDFFDEL